MICENCGNNHDGQYGSGRFCSLKCSRGFSTKAKRSEINSKVAIKLTKSKKTKSKKLKSTKENIIIIPGKCIICKSDTNSQRKIICSKECSSIHRSNYLKGIKPKSGELRKKGSGGLRDGGGKSKVYEYISLHNEKMFLNSEELVIANLLDDLKTTWNRNKQGFEYDENGKIRKFYPDFYVDELKSYVEYKGWLTDSMRKKMTSAVNKNDLPLIIVVGKDVRFKDDGISIKDFKRRLEVL